MAGNSKSANRPSAARTRPAKKNKSATGGGSAAAAVSTRGLYSGPSVRGGSGAVTKFSSTEYVIDVTTPSTSGPPSITLTINAANPNTFPWLSRIAQGFEVYRFTRMRVVYTPSCSSSTNGLVVGGFDFDGTDVAPTTKQQISALEFSGRCNVWNKTEWRMSCPTGWYYCAPTGPIVGDVRLNDTARFYLGVYGTTSSGVTTGELSISYDIEFAKPEMAPYNLSEFINTPGSALNNLAGTPTYAGDVITSLTSPASSQLVFTMSVGGNFLVEVTGSGVAGSAPPNGCVWTSSTLTRAGNTISGATNFVDFVTSYNTSGTSFNHLTLLFFSALAGDIITLVAIGAMTSMGVARLRLAPYKALG